MKIKKLKILITLIILFICQASWSNDFCNGCCSFDDFFKNNYQNLLKNLCPNEERIKFYDILFNAYSIKFKGLDYEFENICAQIDKECSCETDNAKEKIKYLKQLSTIAVDEYDSFLDDISFETCGDETLENPAVKKIKRKYRKQLKKLIAKNCK